MSVEADIWRAALILIERYGQDAAIVGAQRADEQQAAGDSEGQAIWQKIVEAILEWRRADNDKDRVLN